MKKNSVVWITGIFLLLTSVKVWAQEVKTTFIEPQRLFVTFSKTTNLIFPYAIKSIDRGSRDILAQKAIGVENVLQLKAAKANIAETNLTVVTADGGLFSYLVSYTDNPDRLNLKVQHMNPIPQPVAVFSEDATTDAIAATSLLVNAKQQVLHGIKDKDYNMGIVLKGLYIRQDVLYFQLELTNNSNINYDVQQFRFFIRDRKKSKRTASQETELQPLHIAGNVNRIAGTSEQVVTVAIPKITIPDKKLLVIQLLEKSGGRHLVLKVSNKILVRAIRLN
jgi:conjugative transposon TraN protein